MPPVEANSYALNLPPVPALGSVVETLAAQILGLLKARAVCVLLKGNGELALRAVAAENEQLANTVQQAHKGSALIYTTELASRAALANEPIEASSQYAELGKSVIVVPLHTQESVGALFIYPADDYVFTAEHKSLLAGFSFLGAVSISNTQLYASASLDVQDLEILLTIIGKVSKSEDLDDFLRSTVILSAELLGYRQASIGRVSGDRFFVSHIAEAGNFKRVDISFPSHESHALLAKMASWVEDGLALGPERLAFLGPAVRQVLDVPLFSNDGNIVALLQLVDPVQQLLVSKRDIRKGQVLATQLAIALRLRLRLHASEQSSARGLQLSSLVEELRSSANLSEFARNLAARVPRIAGARGGLALIAPLHSRTAGARSPGWEAISWSVADSPVDRGLENRLQMQLAELVRSSREAITSGPAVDSLGVGLAQSLGWQHMTLLRLENSDRELLGAVCLVDDLKEISPEDVEFLGVLVSATSLALQRTRLFTRMEEANRHWVEIFDALTDLIVVHDESENVLRVNRPLARFLKVPPAELIGVNMRALLSMIAETHSTECPFCRKTESGGDEALHQVLDRTYLVSTSRLQGTHTEGLQTIHVLKDVTDRREAERRYRELFDNIQEGLYFSTPGGRFIEVNDALVRILGYESREELLQVDIASHLYFDPSERERFSQIIEDQGVLRNHEEVLRRKDGTPVYTMQNVFAVKDPSGRVLQYRGLMTDITGLKAFQSELQRERDFSSKILNNTQSLILVVDPVGRVCYANRRWADLNYQFQQLLGRRLVDLTPPTKRYLLQDALQSTLEGHQVDNLEVPILRADGRVGQFSVNLSPMRDEQASLTSIVVVMTDITDAAMLQAKLMHAEKMAAVGQLVSGVAHEVNNPLTAILGFADLLMENPDVPDSAKKDLRVILQEAQRTKQIVQNLLSFARQMPPQRKPVQVNAILRRTVQLRAYDFNSHGVEIVERFSDSLADVIGDSQQLQQVFLNILNNAYDAVRDTGRPPRIEITTMQTRGYAEISFRDNGNGIVYPERIFDPFFTTKEVGKGTGLGLSICYGIVREHGGEIVCQNNSGVSGATFIVRLPSAVENVPLGAIAGAVPS